MFEGQQSKCYDYKMKIIIELIALEGREIVNVVIIVFVLLLAASIPTI